MNESFTYNFLLKLKISYIITPNYALKLIYPIFSKISENKNRKNKEIKKFHIAAGKII